MRSQSRIISIVLVLFFIVGCAGVRMSNQERYHNALGIWYDTGMQFKRYYSIADPALQEKWDAEFRPMLIKAKDILNVWYVHLYDSQDVTGDMEDWKQIKNDLLFYIATQMKGKEVG